METALTEVTLRSIDSLTTLSSHDKAAAKVAKHIEEAFAGTDHKVVTAEAKIRTDHSIAEFGMTVEFGDDDKNYINVSYANNNRVSVKFVLVGYGKITRNNLAYTVKNVG